MDGVNTVNLCKQIRDEKKAYEHYVFNEAFKIIKEKAQNFIFNVVTLMLHIFKMVVIVALMLGFGVFFTYNTYDPATDMYDGTVLLLMLMISVMYVIINTIKIIKGEINWYRYTKGEYPKK